MTDEKGADTQDNKEEKILDKEMDQVYSELNVLRDKVKEMEKMITAKDDYITKVDTRMVNQVKGKLLAEVQSFSDYPMEHLTTLTVNDLKAMIDDRKYYKLTTFASSGRAGDTDMDPYVKLHSMFDEAQKNRRERKNR